MKKDATFKWDDKDFVNFYTDSANFIVLKDSDLSESCLR